MIIIAIYQKITISDENDGKIEKDMKEHEEMKNICFFSAYIKKNLPAQTIPKIRFSDVFIYGVHEYIGELPGPIFRFYKVWGGGGIY